MWSCGPGAPKARSTSSSNEVERLSTELANRSAQISQFQAENADALPADQTFRLSRQAVLQERLASAQRELSSLIDQRARIIEIYEATGQIAAPTNVLTDDQRQLRNLERELAQQLSIYSEDAPQIVTLRRRIDTLREQVATTTPETGPSKFRPGGAGPAAWPDRRPDREPRSVIGGNAELHGWRTRSPARRSTRSRCRASNATTRTSACNTTAPSRAWRRPPPANGSN
jgi:capsule polysaccharide export protein KpsE/RkpR